MNNTKVILQLPEPLVSAWPENNFLSSIVQTKDTGYSWLMNTHIQTYGSIYVNDIYGINEIRVTFYPFANIRANVYDLCPFIRKYVIPRKEIIRNYKVFTDFLLNAISDGFYIYAMINEFFREDTPNDFNHPCYFYGYDEKKKIIYCADNFGHGKYQTKEVSFIDINTAFENYKITNWEASVILYEMIEYSFKDCPTFIREQIIDYLHPENNFCYLNRFYCPETVYAHGSEKGEICMGIECYQLLERLITGYINAESLNYIDIRSFVFLCDHKIMMRHRNHYLAEKKMITNDSENSELCNKLLEDCELLLNLMLKVKVSHRKKYLEKALILLKSICQNDILYMNNLFNSFTI